MRTYLVVERPERLEAPGAEFEILHGAVMTEKGLDAWAPRNLETPAGLAFLALAEAAKAKGFALFSLPSKALPDAAGVVTEEHEIGSRKILFRHAPDWSGDARLRWQGPDGGVIELEIPGWLAQDFADGRAEVTKLRAEADAATAKLEAATKALEGERAENARLKNGMVVPASVSRGKRGKAPASPVGALEAPVPADGSKTVADVKADLAATLEKEATAKPGGAKKYRGSGGEPA
jgi:hypothetical protein